MKIKGAKPPTEVIKARTQPAIEVNPQVNKWWDADSKKNLTNGLLSTAKFLQSNQGYRMKQAARYSAAYGNTPVMGVVGSNSSKMGIGKDMPPDRPTMNVIQSCVDTLVSRISQQKPRPVFLTDNGDASQRFLAKQMNQFIAGELYRTGAHRMGPRLLTDAGVLGTGCVQCYEDPISKKAALDRVLQTELYVDPNDAMYGNPRQLIRLKLVDRQLLEASFPNRESIVNSAEQAYPEVGGESAQTVSDQVMVVEGWRLPSGQNADGEWSSDGVHAIVTNNGLLFEEPFKKARFPFAFLHYNPRMLGFWGQPLTEQLFGTQMEITKLLIVISRSLHLMGVPRILIEESSKIAKSYFNNEIGTIIPYRGIPPQFVVAECIAPEIYAQLQRLIEFAYQQSGVSNLAATAKKPEGLDSAVALREYDDLQTDRFASLVKRYDDLFIDLGYLILDQARDIALRDGKYETVYPDKDGVKGIDLPATKLKDNDFVIQCYDTSSLPRDPAGRKEYVVEMMQAGIYTPEEGRRLLGFSDTEQVDKLASAAEERIYKQLDDIVEHGKFTPPDEFTDIQLAMKIVVQYYNLYEPAKLSPARVELLRDYQANLQQKITAMMPPPMPMGPQAVPQAPPQSPMLPNAPVS